MVFSTTVKVSQDGPDSYLLDSTVLFDKKFSKNNQQDGYVLIQPQISQDDNFANKSVGRRFAQSSTVHEMSQNYLDSRYTSIESKLQFWTSLLEMHTLSKIPWIRR